MPTITSGNTFSFPLRRGRKCRLVQWTSDGLELCPNIRLFISFSNSNYLTYNTSLFLGGKMRLSAISQLLNQETDVSCSASSEAEKPFSSCLLSKSSFCKRVSSDLLRDVAPSLLLCSGI